MRGRDREKEREREGERVGERERESKKERKKEGKKESNFFVLTFSPDKNQIWLLSPFHVISIFNQLNVSYLAKLLPTYMLRKLGVRDFFTRSPL